MNSILKRITAVFLAVLLGTAALAGVIPAAAADGIVINETNFPDEVFRNAIRDPKHNVDKDGDGVLSSEEIAQTTELFLSGWVERGSVIKDLKGIEYFTACQTLRITNLGIESIDLSALTNLKTLTAHGTNSYASLDLSKNTALETVSVWGNKNLKELKFAGAVKELRCQECSIAALDLSGLGSLSKLSCYGNGLTALDLSANHELTFINCSSNHIKELDLSGCTKLGAAASDYYIGSQQITAKASFDSDKNIVVPVTFSYPGRLSGSELSEEPLYGYDISVSAFTFTDYSALENGIDYSYFVNLDGAEDMSVNITVEKDFYKVSYLTAENGEEYEYQLVNAGGTAEEPALPPMPEGMVCGYFNEKAENVTEDKTIYAVWADSHNEEITAFKNNVAVISCTGCGISRTVAFADCLNAVTADSNFEPLLDVNKDGIINARDLAEISKAFTVNGEE